jgi:hypothetical protein
VFSNHKPVIILVRVFFMDPAGERIFFTAALFGVALVAALIFCVPVGVASFQTSDRIPGLAEEPVLNVTNSSLPNTSILSKYPVTPTPVRIELVYKATLAGVKGEMATGPRTIGFSLSPEELVILLIALVSVVVCIALIVSRKHVKEN